MFLKSLFEMIGVNVMESSVDILVFFNFVYYLNRFFGLVIVIFVFLFIVLLVFLCKIVK